MEFSVSYRPLNSGYGKMHNVNILSLDYPALPGYANFLAAEAPVK
jgi:hypothetical protein